MSRLRIGVLALQGAFREHIQAFERLGVNATPLRSAGELAELDGIVLPGGESTTIDKLLRKFELQQPLRQRIEDGLPVLATCAGVILLADEVRDGLPDQESLRVLPISVRRNAYGRQPESFESDVEIVGLKAPFPGVFIRSPLIEAVDAAVEVLGSVDGNAVAVRSGLIIGLTFHPELTGDDRLHRLFLEEVVEAAGAGDAEPAEGTA